MADHKQPASPAKRSPLLAVAMGLGMGLFAMGFGAILASCNSDSEIMGVSNSSDVNARRRAAATTKATDKLEFDGKDRTRRSDKGDGTDGDEGEENAEGGEAATEEEPAATEIEYPTLEYKARGMTTCDGNTYNTTASIVTSLNASQMEINMVAARVNCGGRCQKEADNEIAQSIGMTRYTRTPAARLSQLAGEGFRNESVVIFADGVVKPGGQNFQFDRPLPVFPFPQKKNMYSKLDEGPISWQSNVSGTRNFTATVTVSKVAQSGDTITIMIQTDIAQDRGTRILYEEFPLPRKAIYEIDMKTRDVRSIDSTNWFNGEKCKNKPEQVNLLYKMCKKTRKGTSETFACN